MCHECQAPLKGCSVTPAEVLPLHSKVYIKHLWVHGKPQLVWLNTPGVTEHPLHSKVYIKHFWVHGNTSAGVTEHPL